MRKQKVKTTLDVNRSDLYPYKVVGTAKLHFVAEDAHDEQELRKIYSVYVGIDRVRVEGLPEFGERNGIKKLTLSIDA